MSLESTADQVTLGLVEESLWGVDPGTTRKLLRFTNESLASVEESTESQEITGDRQTRDVIRTAFNVQGELGFELSADAFDDLFMGMLMKSTLGDNDVIQKSYTLERAYGDVSTGAGGTSRIYTGCMVNTFSVTIAPRSVVTGTFGILGKTESAGTTMTTPTAAPTKKVLNAINNVTAITEGGSSVNLLELTINLNNNLRARPEIGSLAPVNIALGSLIVSGRLRAYYRNATLAAKFQAETESSLAVTLTDAGGEGYSFTMPRVRFSSARRVAGAKNSDIILEMDWQALRKTSSPNQTITVAALP